MTNKMFKKNSLSSGEDIQTVWLFPSPKSKPKA
jgi:hypothetical protein